MYAFLTMDQKFRAYFEGKKITVMGLGLLGRGVGDAAFLAECGAEVLVTDLKSKTELATSVAALKNFQNVSFVLGAHRMEDFENRDMILVAAGVPMDSLYLAHARESGVPLEMSAALFVRLSGIPIVGITGTRGKSTVTGMIHHVLTEVTEGARVLLGGNVRGVSNLQLLKEVEEDSIAVMELDSWQLQGFGWAKISPHVAVFTNFMPDHLNYYKNDLDAYFADKANIFLNQEDSDVFVTTPEVFERAKKFAQKRAISIGQEVVLADASLLPDDLILLVPGEHNRLNAALAFEALRAMSLTSEEIVQGLSTFAGLPGRLEFLREVNGVKIYNDNNATTPAATLTGLRALGDENKKNVVLIMGGADKTIDMGELLQEVPRYVKKVVLLPGTGSDRIKERLQDSIEVGSLKEAVVKATDAAVPGDTILFSPAFASFGLFKNEYDRNDQFVEVIDEL
jgi:UDP-N-acetylmuramoylalanine--D-glutamate ligase